MSNKNKDNSKLTIKNINKVFGIIIFVLVFLFTFLITAKDLADKQLIILIVFSCIIGVTLITWLIIFLIIKNQQNASDFNKIKIDEAIRRIDNQEKVKNNDQ